MTTTEYLQREIRRVELSIRRAERKPNVPHEELRGLHEKLEHLQDALAAVEEHWQRVHSERGRTAGKPLTVEQLRGMDKPTPVWMEADKKTVEGWGGYWCICQRGHILTPGMVSMYADKMDGATFYSYPPACIDREKWEPCEYCQRRTSPDEVSMLTTDENGSETGMFVFNGILASNTDGLQMRQIYFCPICGRPLSEESWAELERRVCGG